MFEVSETFDFIVVGGGTSGSVLASRLAETPSAPKVLLLEAGGPNDDLSLRSPSNRYMVAFTQPSMNYGYKSTPQNHLVGQQVNCYRGRGLGGSSAINFCVWFLGHKEDFNEWADLVGDDMWKWDGEGGVKERFRKIENLHDEIKDEEAKYLDRHALSRHSKEGKVDISWNEVWAEIDTLGLEAAKEFGGEMNMDVNSGDPTGFGLSPSSYHNGLRTTASTAYLSSPPSNLKILTDTSVTNVIFDDSKTAIGIQTISGQTFTATKEVILSAGAIDSPKILLLSGIGPSASLSALTIPFIHDLPGVGQGLKDHSFITTTLLLKPKAQPENHDPHGTTGAQAPTAWLPSPASYASNEFAALDQHTKEHLLKVPAFEMLATNVPLAGVATPKQGDQVITLFTGVMNSQSTGSVTLASANPTDAPIINTNYLSHPYDRRIAIEGLRTVVKWSKQPSFTAVTESVIEGPTGDTDEELLEHCKKAVQSLWHFGGTCRMGRDEGAVVDREFRVRGVKGLRVVDHAVAPLMVNNHTQSTCYLIGETAAEKMILEYGL